MRDDWRTLAAGRELDRLIAERLGWRVEKATWEPASSADRGWMYVLTSPMGHRAAFGHADPSEAWFMTRDTSDYREVYLRPYSEKFDVALIALVNGQQFELRNFDDTFHVGKWEATIDSYLGMADDPVLAMCRAWLNRDDQINDPH